MKTELNKNYKSLEELMIWGKCFLDQSWIQSQIALIVSEIDLNAYRTNLDLRGFRLFENVQEIKTYNKILSRFNFFEGGVVV